MPVEEGMVRQEPGAAIAPVRSTDENAPSSADELLAELAVDRDAAFEALVISYQDRLYAFALRLSGRPADAEDLTQDALLRAYAALGHYPPERIRALALRPWLYQITLNVYRNWRRGQPRAIVSFDPSDGSPPPDPPADEREGPPLIAERRESGRELGARLLALPEQQRIPLVLRHVEGWPYAEIAALLGQPIGTVKANVHRGARRLRSALGEEEL
jgi:RNA polymerase sigma-70 factor (ECF subfamily)